MLFPLHLARIGTAFATTLLLGAGLPALSHAAEQSAPEAANDYIRCSKTSLDTAGPEVLDNVSGFGVVVKGERYFFNLRERVKITFNSPKDGLPIAHVLVDRPPSEEFEEHRAWRERFIEDVAERANSNLERLEPAAGLRAVTVNKKNLKGEFLGLSLLTDRSRGVMVQWNWDNAKRYASPSDLSALQTSIWKDLGPCLTQK
jgi:hypothetical protein